MNEIDQVIADLNKKQQLLYRGSELLDRRFLRATTGFAELRPDARRWLALHGSTRSSATSRAARPRQSH